MDLHQGSEIKVAVLDSGVANDNPDIAPKVVARANFSSGATGEDNYGHGTTLPALWPPLTTTQGVAGVCPGCTILDGKVLNDSGIGSSSGLVNGINWAVSNGAKVINMSLGVRASRTLETAVNNAWSKGVVLVAAAGNGGNQTKIYPGAYPNVIAVAATDNNDAKAPFSTYGASWVDIAAPGANVYSTFPNHPFVPRHPKRPLPGLRRRQRHLHVLADRRCHRRPCLERDIPALPSVRSAPRSKRPPTILPAPERTGNMAA